MQCKNFQLILPVFYHNNKEQLKDDPWVQSAVREALWRSAQPRKPRLNLIQTIQQSLAQISSVLCSLSTMISLSPKVAEKANGSLLFIGTQEWETFSGHLLLLQSIEAK